jgi:hypothetical protein
MRPTEGDQIHIYKVNLYVWANTWITQVSNVAPRPFSIGKLADVTEVYKSSFTVSILI